MLVKRKKFQSKIEIFSNEKKASLEISIQAIVIVVLAMTLLGLGLGFIKGMFKNITGTTEDVSEQIKEQVLTDLRTGDKKISFPKTEITLEKGGTTVLTVGIKNKGNDPLNYRIEFSELVDQDGEPFEADSWFQFGQPIDGFTLPTAESHIRSIKINMPKSVPSGSYALTFDVVNVDEQRGTPDYIYDQKDFFIVVTG